MPFIDERQHVNVVSIGANPDKLINTETGSYFLILGDAVGAFLPVV